MKSVTMEYKIKMNTNKAKLLVAQNRTKLQSALMGDRLVPAYLRLMQVIPPVVEAMATFAEKSARIYRNNRPLINTLGAVALGITGIVLATKTVGVITGLFNPVSLAIAGIAGASYLIYKNWGGIKSFFTDLWTGVKNRFNTGMGYLKTALSYSPIGLVMKNWKPITKAFKAVTKSIKAPFVSLFNWVSKKFEWLMNKIVKVKNALTFSDKKKSILRVEELKKTRHELFKNKKALVGRPLNNIGYSNTKPIIKAPVSLKDSLGLGHNKKTPVSLKDSFNPSNDTMHKPIIKHQYLKKVVGLSFTEQSKALSPITPVSLKDSFNPSNDLLKTFRLDGLSILPIESPSEYTESLMNSTRNENINKNTNINRDVTVNNTNHMNISITALDGKIDADSFAIQLDDALAKRELAYTEESLTSGF